jgi:hypothetical protein
VAHEREAPLRQGTGSAAGRPSDLAADPATEPGSNRVIVIFRPAAAGTQVEVRHLSYVPGSAHFYQTAWAECLARLQAGRPLAPPWLAQAAGGVGDEALADLAEDLDHGHGGGWAVGAGGQGGPHLA